MEKNIAFGIKGIEVINSIIKSPTETRKLSGFAFDIQFKTNISPKDNIVSVFADVVIRDNERTDQIGQFSATFHYGVDDLGKLVTGKKELNQLEIPQPLLTALMSVSLSSLRGLMFGSFRGTFLHNAILPIVDVSTLQPELTPMLN